MAQETEEERTERPTPHKLEEARRQGQVAKSPDLLSLVALSVLIIAIFAMGPGAVLAFLDIASRLMASAGQATLTQPYVHAFAEWYSSQLVRLLAPLLLILAVAGGVANLLLSGPVFSTKALRPDFSRLNPMQGLKRIFSMRTVYETLKTIVKISLLIAATYLLLRAQLPHLIELVQTPPARIPERLVSLAGLTLFALVGSIAIVGIVDVVYARWEFLKRMRMSTRELREEIRRQQGDPKIKSKRRELLLALRKASASTGRVKDASVVIVNPTHLAIALQYRRGERQGPRVLSKGAGDLARRIRALAFRHRVPVVENPTLARALYAIEIGEHIPEALFGPVAEILRRVMTAPPRVARG